MTTPRPDPLDAAPEPVPAEPEGLIGAVPAPGGWELLPEPEITWPTIVRGLAYDPEPPPANLAPPLGELGRTELAYDPRARPGVDIFRTIWFELRGAGGPEPEGLISGGSLVAVAIVGVLLAGIAGVGFGWNTAVVAVSAVVFLGIGVLGWLRSRRGPTA